VSVRSLALAASLLVLGLVGAGCSGDPAKPKPLKSSTAAASSSGSATASTSPSASVTASSSAAAPTMPAAAKGTSAAAAEAFARYYVDLINYAMRTGDTDPMRSTTEKDCRTCFVVANGIDNIYRTHGRIKGDGWQVLRASTSKPRRSEARVKMHVRITKQTVFDSPSARPSSSRPSNGRLELALIRSSRDWAVRKLEAFDD
jgi:Family of unknown function (DUF6318)